jgi:hypothetical protein
VLALISLVASSAVLDAAQDAALKCFGKEATRLGTEKTSWFRLLLESRQAQISLFSSEEATR